MLNDQITISVDDANNDVLVDTDFNRHTEFQNRSVYVSDAHTVAMRDELSFYRAFPKRNGNFNGVSKSSIKLTRDMEVPGFDSSTSLLAPLITEINFSVPVGVTAADILRHRQTLYALLDVDVIMDKLVQQLMV